MRIFASEIAGMILDLFPEGEDGIVKRYRGTFQDLQGWFGEVSSSVGGRVLMVEMVFPEIVSSIDRTYLHNYPVGVILFERISDRDVPVWQVRENLANLLLEKLVSWCENVNRRAIAQPSGFSILSASVKSGRLDIAPEGLADGWVASGVSVWVEVSVPKEV